MLLKGIHSTRIIPLNATLFTFSETYPRMLDGLLPSHTYTTRVKELNDQIKFAIQKVPSRAVLVFSFALLLFLVPSISTLTALLAPFHVSIPVCVVLALMLIAFLLMVNLWLPRLRKQNVQTVMSVVGSTLNKWNREDVQDKKLVWNVLPGNSEHFIDFRNEEGQIMIPKPPLGIQVSVHTPSAFIGANPAFSTTSIPSPPRLEFPVDDFDTKTLYEESERK